MPRCTGAAVTMAPFMSSHPDQKEQNAPADGLGLLVSDSRPRLIHENLLPVRAKNQRGEKGCRPIVLSRLIPHHVLHFHDNCFASAEYKAEVFSPAPILHSRRLAR